MEQKQIDRINELAKKAKSPEGLTEWEEMERAARAETTPDCRQGCRGCGLMEVCKQCE